MIKFLFMSILMLVFFSQITFAKTTELTVGTDAWPPFRILDDRYYRGIDFDLLQEIEKRLNVKIKIKRYPWSRILHNLKSGDVDFMTGLAKRKEREKYVTYTSTPYYTCSTVFYVKKGNANMIEKYEDLYKFPIAHVANSAYFKKFDEDKKLNKHAIPSEIQLIKMLGKDRVKVIIGTDCQADYEISKLGLTNEFEKAVYKPENNVDLYIAVSKKSPFIKEMKVLNEVIKNIIIDGKIKEFSQKYYK